MGGFPFIESQHEKILGSKRPRTTPFFIPSLIPNMASGLLSIKKGFKGTNFSISSACASSGHAIEIGMRLIQAGALDAVVVGGAEAVVTPLTTAGFHSMKALSKRDVDPQLASCPFSKNRDGFVIAEGAGVLILENKEKAKNRGQKLLAEIAAASSSADAFHITAPAKDGSGAMACMRGALTEAGIKPEEIDYINAHGTSTPIGDKVETEAIKNVFGEYSNKVNISSTKSMSGHLLGAAAGLESALCVQSLIEQQILPTANLTEPDELCDLNYTPLKAVNKPLRYVMNNSFGFGGTNSCIIFKHT
jgi:3-oxoacyl-[acyl-carrier-protein] synthase II